MCIIQFSCPESALNDTSIFPQHFSGDFIKCGYIIKNSFKWRPFNCSEVVRVDVADIARDDGGLLSFPCHSVLYTASTGDCVLYEADIFAPGVDLVTSPTSDIYQLVCVQVGRANIS